MDNNIKPYSKDYNILTDATEIPQKKSSNYYNSLNNENESKVEVESFYKDVKPHRKIFRGIIINVKNL
jgi:hypothetical protein